MNRVILIGNTVKKPELRATGNGTNVTTFQIAVNRKRKLQDGTTATDFVSIVAWASLAEIACKYLEKGNKVAVIGELQSRVFEAKDGVKKYITEVAADDIEFLTPKQKHVDVSTFQEVDDEDLPY